jgi:hypothetical protein
MSSADKKFQRVARKQVAKRIGEVDVHRPLFVKALTSLPFRARVKVAWKIVMGRAF